MTRGPDTLARGVDWIAQNDEPRDTNVDTVADQISVLLLADIFDCSAEYVARRVVARRRSIEKVGARIAAAERAARGGAL